MKVTKKQLQEMIRKEAKRQLQEQVHQSDYKYLNKVIQDAYDVAVELNKAQNPTVANKVKSELKTALKVLNQLEADMIESGLK